MRRLTGIGFLCGLLALVSVPVAWSAVTVTQIRYHGWQGAYRLSNGTVELVFVPQIGRIMRYGYVGGPNVLWENPHLRGKTTEPAHAGTTWVNFGGDKVWPAPQSRWNWPPDPYLDGSRFTVRVLSNKHLLVTSPVSKKLGLRVIREFALDPAGTGVLLKNTLSNAGDEYIEWSIWEVTQSADPEVVHLPLHKGGHFADGYTVFKGDAPAPGRISLSHGQIRFRRHPKRSSKIGTDSPAGWIAADEAGIRFVVSTAYEAGGEYPDDGCAQEVYSNPDPDKYMEMELLSPMQALQPGDSAYFITHWRLSRLTRATHSRQDDHRL